MNVVVRMEFYTIEEYEEYMRRIINDPVESRFADDPIPCVPIATEPTVTAHPNTPVETEEPDDDTQNDTPPAVDSRDMPWDERIHSGTHALNKDGTWRNKRGVDKDLLAAVEAELMAEPAVEMPITIETPNDTPAPPAANDVPPPPPAPPAATVTPPEMMAAFSVRQMDWPKINEFIKAQFKLETLAEAYKQFESDPGLPGRIVAALEASNV